MLHDDLLHLLAGNILAAGDDDVLRAVLQLDVAVGVPHRQVAGVEPAASKRSTGGLSVAVVSGHDHVPAHHDLAHGLAIAGDILHFLVDHAQAVTRNAIRHALASLDQCPLLGIEIAPAGLIGTDCVGAVRLGQAVQVLDLRAHPLHRANDLWRWRRASRGNSDTAEVLARRVGTGVEGGQNCRRAAHVRDAPAIDESVDFRGYDLA